MIGTCSNHRSTASTRGLLSSETKSRAYSVWNHFLPNFARIEFTVRLWHLPNLFPPRHGHGSSDECVFRSESRSFAELCYADAIRLQEDLLKASPAAAVYADALAVSLNNLGMVQSRTNRFTEAESSFRRSIQLYDTLRNSLVVSRTMMTGFSRLKLCSICRSSSASKLKLSREPTKVSPSGSSCPPGSTRSARQRNVTSGTGKKDSGLLGIFGNPTVT